MLTTCTILTYYTYYYMSFDVQNIEKKSWEKRMGYTWCAIIGDSLR